MRILDGLELWVRRFQRPHQRQTSDVFVAILGDDVSALQSLDREAAFMVLPVEGPWAVSQCERELDAEIVLRYPVQPEARARMLTDIEALGQGLALQIWSSPIAPLNAPHDDGAAAALLSIHRVVPGRPRYQYGQFPGQNTALARLPLRVEFG